MRRATIMPSILCSLLLANGIPQTTVRDQDIIEYDRRVAARAKNKIPADGYVPDAATAISIATAVSIPIFGKEKVDSEVPLKAGLKGNVWTVIGTFSGKGMGGELIVQLDKKTGAVLFVGHTQ